VAVLDSSVLVPEWSRLSLQRIAAAPEPPYTPAWSEWIIAETWRVLTQRWLARYGHVSTSEEGHLRDTANRMMRRLLQVMRLHTLSGYAGPASWPELTDANDEPVWQTAVVAGARYVVSNNTHHVPPLVDGLHVYRGVEYLTAIEFIEDVLGINAETALQGALPHGARLRSRRTTR
jgi:hypothetical protein